MEKETDHVNKTSLEVNFEVGIDGHMEETLSYGRMTLVSGMKNLGKNLLLLNPRISQRLRQGGTEALRTDALCGKSSPQNSVTNADSHCASSVSLPTGAVTKDFDCGKLRDESGNIHMLKIFSPGFI